MKKHKLSPLNLGIKKTTYLLRNKKSSRFPILKNIIYFCLNGFKSKKFLIFIGAITTILFLFIILGKIKLFAVSHIDVEIYDAPCINDQQVREDSKLRGQNIFLINEKKVKDNLSAKYHCLKDFKLDKGVPSNIKLVISGRIPMARVGVYKPDPRPNLGDLGPTASEAALINWSVPPLSDNSFLLVDQTGQIFSKDERSDLPVLFLPVESLKIGQKLDEALSGHVNTIFSKIGRMEFPTLSERLIRQESLGSSSAKLIVNDNITNELIIKAKMDGDSLIVQQPQKIVFSLSRDVLRQLASLQLILQKAKIDGKTMEFIDLRFENPVVRYYNGKR